ncbi:MAG: cobalamin-dependent protein [Spirochaetales bacterium]|nr:cobalamin-dependent protein [Spirochaetales bacterium]
MNKNEPLKIILVQPSVEDFYFTPHRSSSLGLYTLAASWESKGHSCQVINCTMEKSLKKQIKLPSSLNYLKPYLLKQNKDMKGTSWFSQYYRFGPSTEICVEKILDNNPDVIAVSCFAWSYSDNSRQLLQKLQEIRKKSSLSFLLIAGGPGVTVMPEYFTSYADLIFIGEGEDAVFTIEKMANISVEISDYPGRGKIINLEYTGELPFVYNIRNRRNSRFTVSTIISRGCPKRCSFCANHLVFGRSLRKVSLLNLKQGMDSLIDEITAKNKKQQEKLRLHINFEDDNILFYKDYFLEILKYINGICKKNEIDFSFTTENGMDYNLLDNKLLDKF